MSREKQIIEDMAKVIEKTEQIARDAHCGLPSPRMYAKDLYWHGYRKQSEGEWISVDERLPEDGVWVLGYSAKSGRGGLCNCLKSYVREFGNYDDTTHWLPLPEFPKKKG